MIGRLPTVAAVVVVGLVVVLGGLYAAGVLGAPDAGLADNAWGEVDDDRIEVVTAVWIDNPNPVSVDGAAVDYAMAMNGVWLAEGGASDVAVPTGNSTTEIRTDLRYDRLPAWWAAHVEAGETSDLRVEAETRVSAGPLSGSPTVAHEDVVETDLEAMIEASLAENEGEHELSPIPVDGAESIEPTVVIEDTDAEWGDVSEDRTELYLTFDVHNPNAYPLPTPALSGEFVFNDRDVAAWDAHEVELLRGAYDATIPPGETREITFVVELDNDDVVDWFASHVDRDEYTRAEVTAQLAMNVNGHTVTIPADEEAIRCEYDVTTDIFVDQEAGIDRDRCELAPWAGPDDLDEVGATIDLAETEWWETAVLEPDGDGEDDDADDVVDLGL